MKKFKGFTLIELLIVIALLGALAVGLLAALDPFEQLKKGTDTGVQNTVSELQGSIIRYYAIKNQMPWCADSTCSTFEDSMGDTITAKTADLLPQTIANIVAAGELKADFSTLAGGGTLKKMVVFGSESLATVEVCYLPTSKSFTNSANTKFSPTDGKANDNGGVCAKTGDPTTNTCLWCVL